jgi:hypothetical protein
VCGFFLTIKELFAVVVVADEMRVREFFFEATFFHEWILVLYNFVCILDPTCIEV